MEASLKANDWLTNSTKEKALLKLSKFVVKIGYPDKWKDFSSLELTEDMSLFEMRQRVQAFDFRTDFLEKLNSQKDRTEWEMSPQTVNAYFHPPNNEMCPHQGSSHMDTFAL
jgi:putative endopeptidase